MAIMTASEVMTTTEKRSIHKINASFNLLLINCLRLFSARILEEASTAPLQVLKIAEINALGGNVADKRKDHEERCCQFNPGTVFFSEKIARWKDIFPIYDGQE